MKFTKLDLSDKLDALYVKHEKASQKPGGHRAKGAMIKECEKEIDRQVGIYNKEEAAYEESVSGKLSIAKDLNKEMLAAVSTLENQWDDKVFSEMPKKLARITKFIDIIDKDAIALSAHQDFRGNDCFNKQATDAQKFLGAADYKKLTKRYKDGRAAKINVVAEVKGMRQKLQEYKNRGEDAIKTAIALQKQHKTRGLALPSEAAEALKDAKASLKEVVNLHGDLQTGIDKIMKAMLKFLGRRDPCEDPAMMAAADLTQKAANVANKKFKPAAKTASVHLANLNKVAKPFGRNKDVQKALTDLEKAVDKLTKLIKGFVATQKQFDQKLKSEQAKVA